MSPRVTLILKRASSPLAEKIATTWRLELREREREYTGARRVDRSSRRIYVLLPWHIFRKAEK